MSLYQEVESRLSALDLSSYRSDGNPHAPIALDLDHVDETICTALAAAAFQDGGFWYHSSLLENDKNPKRAAAQARATKKVFTYATLPDEAVAPDDGALWNYQAGRTAPGTERAINESEELASFPFRSGERALYIGEANASGRWMEPVVFRPFTGVSKFTDLRGAPIVPDHFAKQDLGNEWREDLLTIGKPLYEIGDLIARSLARGLGLDPELFMEQMTYRQDLLGPTFCDITESKENDNISAGHFDCDFGTSLTYSVVGSPQAPGLLVPAGGLHVWTRKGERQEFEKPKAPGYAFFQFGRGGRQMTAGLIYPELHEAVVTKRLLDVREQFKNGAQAKGFDVKQIFRVNFAYFTTPDVDAWCAIRPNHPLYHPDIATMYTKNAHWGDHFHEEFSGTGLRKE